MSSMKPNKWVSIQSLLAEEEDRTQNHEPLISVPESMPSSNPAEIKSDQDLKSTRAQRDLVAKQLRHGDLDVKGLSREATKTQDDLDILRLSREVPKSLYDQLPHYRTFNVLDDEILPILTVIEQAVLRRLVRLSYGFNKQVTDPVSINKLAEKCNLSITAVKKALVSLESRELITRYSDNSRNPAGGNRYAVLTKTFGDLAAKRLSREESKTPDAHIKDHEDFKNTSHHQSETMKIYQSLTGNAWTKADQKAYNQIKHLPLERIEATIQAVNDRAKDQPRSLNYFVQEMLNTGQGKPRVKKPALAVIISQLRDSYTGARVEEFREAVRRACSREGVSFDLSLFNEILGI